MGTANECPSSRQAAILFKGKMDSEARESRALAPAQPALPEEPNRFIGRERELSYLRGTLHRTRALTLCGAGGIGKTRLALRLLATVAAGLP